MFTYAAKLAVFVITAVLGSNIAAALIEGDFSNPTVLWGLLITGLGAVVMFLKANTPEQPELKKGIALFTVVALGVVAAATDHSISSAEIAQILLAFFGALQTGTFNNVGDSFNVKTGETA